MGSDIALVVGLICVILSIPALISAFSSGQPLRRATVFVTLGGALIVYAVVSSPTGYRASDVPEVVLRVIAQLIR